MPATTFNFTRSEGRQVEQGADFSYTWTVWATTLQDTPRDLTGYTARMQIRSAYTQPDPATVILTSGAGIVLGGAAGTVQVTLTAAQTTALGTPGVGSNWVYDLELVAPGGQVIRLVEGAIEVTPEVTR